MGPDERVTNVEEHNLGSKRSGHEKRVYGVERSQKGVSHVPKKADFTADEWKALRTGLLGAGMFVSLSDRDFTDTFGEVGAMTKFLSGMQMTGSTDLMRELAHEHGNPFGLTSSPDRVRDDTLAALKSAAVTLTAKAPDEVGPYRDFVLGLAAAVAAAKSGKSAVETAAIGQIREALT